jgi:hypothetical protein
LRPRTEGAIELTSRDDENYHRVEVNVSGANPANGGDGSVERIPGPKPANITKTAMVEMKSEERN